MLVQLVGLSIPVKDGQFFFENMWVYFVLFYAGLSYNYWKTTIFLLLAQAYLGIGIRYFMYESTLPIGGLLLRFVFDAAQLFICCLIVHIFLSWIGFKNLDLELMR